MPQYQKTSQGAYGTGGSIAYNQSEQVDIRTQEQFHDGDDPILETRYYCSASVTIEVKFDTGKEILRQSERVRLIGEDGKDYKLAMWTAEDIAKAIGQAVLDADTQLKNNWGNGDPVNHGSVTTTIS